MSSTEIKAAAEEILQRVQWPFDTLMSNMLAKGELPVKHEIKPETIAVAAEIITRHLTPAGAEEAARSLVKQLFDPDTDDTAFGKECTQRMQDWAFGYALSAIQSVRPEVAVMEKLIAEINRIAADSPELNMSNYDEGQVSALNDGMIDICIALAGANKVLKPHEEERKQ